MNFSRLKSNIASIRYNLTNKELPKDFREEQIENYLKDMELLINTEQTEYNKTKKIAWELANRL